MYYTSRALFNPENDPDKDDWHFYHDALALLTSESCKEWMRQRGILKHWILPEQGLQDNDPDLSRYANNPVGNSPDFMPLDTSLNRDMHTDVNRHCMQTVLLPEDDPRKFSLSTPKRGDSAYVRVWQGCPEDRRILQDVLAFKNRLLAAYKAKGTAVVNTPGHRGVRASSTSANRNHGGKRNQSSPTVDQYRSKWYHPDCKSAMEDTAAMTLDEIAARRQQMEVTIESDGCSVEDHDEQQSFGIEDNSGESEEE